MKKFFVVTDNKYILYEFIKIAASKNLDVTFYCSPKSEKIFREEITDKRITPLVIKNKSDYFIKKFDIGFSCHSKQIFPQKLIENVLCLNIHPGFNPYNRGWYPQVFSIINGLPAGATIHVMDKEIDHGDIIAQVPVVISESDDSLSAYTRIQKKEIELLASNIDDIVNGDIKPTKPKTEGNYNSIQDYKKICEIDMDKEVTMREAINLLRALTHSLYNNAYYTSDEGKKIFIKIELVEE